MRPFKFVRAANELEAVTAVKGAPANVFVAGGTNLLDLMKEDVARPTGLVDITRLPMAQIRSTKDGVSLGALATNSATANDPVVRRDFPLLSQAILAGASGQIRNMATNGGNLLQRTRCPYFYDTAMPCNKREPNSGCGALEGVNKQHAIFGWSEKCVATFPSDMAVALAALDAKVVTRSADKKSRTIDFDDFHRLPGDDPTKDNTLMPGELITEITIPKNRFNRSYYLKVRDRASYAFAIVSVAIAMETKGGVINGQPRIALGGVAHKPWRLFEAEKFLAGKKYSDEILREAAELGMKDAKPLAHNKYKIELATRAIVRAGQMAMGGE